MANRTVWLGLALLALSNTAVAATDACQQLLPASLQAVLESPTYRLPRESDSHSPCVEDRRRAHGNTCLLAASGDFDGERTAEYVIILPAIKDGGGQLVVARADRMSWKVEIVRVLKEGNLSHTILAPLPPGEYHETPAGLPAGVVGRVVRSTHDGFMLGSCESAASGFFLLGESWFSLALTD